MQTLPRIFVLCVLLGLTGVASAADPADKPAARLSLEDRMTRMENMLSSQGLVDIVLKLESLQNEVQRLRGEIEVQHHTLEELKKRQRDLYVDLDRRLLQLERNTPVTGTSTTTPATPPASAGSAVASGAPAASTSGKAVAKPAASKKVPPAPVSKTEQQAYQAAFDQLRELRYDKATELFRDFLQKYPKGRYAHIAQYWLGEANYAQRKFEEAIRDYQGLIDNYPGSPKLAEAMLKIGYSQYELKNLAAAQETLERLIRTYPGTTEAGQAQNLLQKIRMSGGH